MVNDDRTLHKVNFKSYNLKLNLKVNLKELTFSNTDVGHNLPQKFSPPDLNPNQNPKSNP